MVLSISLMQGKVGNRYAQIQQHNSMQKRKFYIQYEFLTKIQDSCWWLKGEKKKESSKCGFITSYNNKYIFSWFSPLINLKSTTWILTSKEINSFETTLDYVKFGRPHPWRGIVLLLLNDVFRYTWDLIKIFRYVIYTGGGK